MAGEVLGEIWAVAATAGPVDVRVFVRGVSGYKYPLSNTPKQIVAAGVPLTSLVVQNLGSVSIELGNDRSLQYGEGLRIPPNALLSNGQIVPGGGVLNLLERFLKAGLPAAGNAGRLAQLIDYDRSVWLDTGASWWSLTADVFYVKAFGAVGGGVIDDTVPIKAAIAAAAAIGGGDVVLSSDKYRVTSTLDLANGVRLRGEGAPNHWGQNPALVSFPVFVDYRGTIAAVRLAPGANGHIRNVSIENIQFDGTNAVGAVDGIVFDCTAAGADIQGFDGVGVMFSNFSHSQIAQPACGAGSALWGITFRRGGAHDHDIVSTTDLVSFAGPVGQVAEITFDDFVLIPYRATEWALKALVTSIRLIGGTIAAGVPNANGVWITSGTSIVGTHVEGSGSTGIGIRVSGVGGHFIAPSFCATWATGVQIGDATAAGVAGAFVGGSVGGNTTDVNITNGGSRRGTIIGAVGDTGGAGLVVLNQRATIDGIYELIRLDGNRLIVPPGAAAAPQLVAEPYLQTGPWIDLATGDLVWSVAGVARMRMPAATVALAVTAQLYPGSGNVANTQQLAAGLLGGTGVPNNAVGNNGDVYFDSAGGAGAHIYVKRAGVWAAIV